MVIFFLARTRVSSIAKRWIVTCLPISILRQEGQRTGEIEETKNPKQISQSIDEFEFRGFVVIFLSMIDGFRENTGNVTRNAVSMDSQFEILRQRRSQEFDKIQIDFAETGNSVSYKVLIKKNVRFYGRLWLLIFWQKSAEKSSLKKKVFLYDYYFIFYPLRSIL